MPTAPSRTSRLEARIAPDALAAVRRAAEIQGRSVSDFVVDAARRCLGEKIAQFVPAHPIAGAERSGVEAATASLFQDRLVVLTPVPKTAPEARERVEAAWRECGARVVQMDPERHDQVFAAVSHLPHALAFALVHMIAARPDVYFITPHYAGTPYVLVRLATVDEQELDGLLVDAWRLTAPKRLVARFDAAQAVP